MHYRFSNDYGARWPFWAVDGLCADRDPKLPAEREVRDWADQFEQLFDWEHGWPDEVTADEHRAEGMRLYEEIQRELPDATITFQYWETAYRTAP
jgi:hypothetical protein